MRTLALSVCFFFCVCSLLGVQGKMHYLEWTVAAVDQYLGSSLEVELGDYLLLGCLQGKFSNVQLDWSEEHFEKCNSTPGVPDGQSAPTDLGFCKGESAHNLSLAITRPSASLRDLLAFEPGSAFYLMSFSNGSSLIDAITQRESGGECLDDLKLKVTVVEPFTTTSTMGFVSSTEPTAGLSNITQAATESESLTGIIEDVNRATFTHITLTVYLLTAGLLLLNLV